MRSVLLLLVLLVVAVPAHGQGEVSSPSLDTVTLTDGSVLKGRIVEEDDARVVLETKVGRLEIPRVEIAMIERRDAQGRSSFEGNTDPDFNSVFLTPTPETIGSGGYFRNFLLFFLNWGFALHEDVDVSVGTFFPVTTEFYWLSAGVKWRLASREDHPVGVALLANGNLVDGHRSGSVGGVVGVGDRDRSLNVSVGRYVGEDDVSSTVFLVGVDARTGGRSKVLLEYATSSELIDEDLEGLINVGFRWYGERMSFSLTGFRPLSDTGDLVFLPFTMFSMHF